MVSYLPKPDLFHPMQISMRDHLQKWSFQFIKMHEQLDKYNAIWFSLPTSQDLTSKTMSYKEVSQLNGKEVKQISQYLLGVVKHSLGRGSPTQHPIFNCPIVWTQALFEFYMYALYESHDDAALIYM
jgi:hypothetical protein